MGIEEPFAQIAAILGVAVVAGALALLLRQPLIVAFIAVGILVGPSALGIVEDADAIAVFAKIGISLLLFVVGLRLDLHLIRSVGPVALVTGLGQVAFTSVFGFALALGLGLSATAAAYTAVALTFSSTIIIVKLLSDKREIDELHGRIAIGFLIVQDVCVVIAMIALTAFAGDGGFVDSTLAVVAKGALLVAGLYLVTRFLVGRALHRLAHNPELLLLVAIAWGLGVAVVTDRLGFSTEVGAFLAGVAIASTPFRDALGSRLVPLRDFLLLFFFVDLGVSVELSLAGSQVVPALVLSAFVLVGNPLIVMVIMGLLGYHRRTSLLAGLTVAQISEFSLILAALGLSLGQITEETVGLITAVGLVTISLSTYMILYSERVYSALGPHLRVFERRRVREPLLPGEGPEPEVLVFGLGRYGGALAGRLREEGFRVLGVDFDPQALARAGEAGLPVLYADAEDPELPQILPLGSARAILSTLRRHEAELALLAALRRHGFTGPVGLTAQSALEAERLAGLDVDWVLMPFDDAADVAFRRVLDALPRPGSAA